MSAAVIAQVSEKPVAPAPHTTPAPTLRQRWLTVADFAVLAAWLLLASFTLLHHEKWADEAQSWLLARDLDLPALWFKELRYEGAPGLWHSLLWLAQRLFHLPYAGLGPLGLLCATAGVALMLLRAPFPRPVRWLLAFSYFFVYQYAVIARPYVLLPLLAFAAAIFFKDQQHPVRITIILVLLANLSIHGAMFAACIGLAYLLQGVQAWAGFGERLRGRYVLCAGAMLLVYFFLFNVLNPPPDAEALVFPRTFSGVCYRTWQGLDGAFFDFTPLTILWLLLLSVWCFTRRSVNAIVLPLMVLSLGFFWGYYGGPHHLGTILVAAITGLWIAWPATEETRTFAPWQRHTHQALLAALLCLLAYQTWNAAVVIRHEYNTPYCGAQDAANYLKAVGADHQTILGNGYGMVAVQAYFDHNIDVSSPTAYYHHGEPYTSKTIGSPDIRREAPDYIVIPCFYQCDISSKTEIEPFMRTMGYSLAHFSDGYALDKRGWYMRHIYFIYHRDQ